MRWPWSKRRPPVQSFADPFEAGMYDMQVLVGGKVAWSGKRYLHWTWPEPTRATLVMLEPIEFTYGTVWDEPEGAMVTIEYWHKMAWWRVPMRVPKMMFPGDHIKIRIPA